ncbi:hypothetical protein ACT17_15240 [Mycolicibacterium conceptionense]|uniref:Uncharacterized protein n=1 Tax=Mycolicibacterium conceptionense TaxID=451644 RepID=A0A0J8U9E5_9MYCO|nr:hypothetical protein [Mycolicibacterium conceptionense]KMV17632.1 hypothetical protein ACT17_15240 [Mycolicibacterium conceptionense]
MTAQIQRFRARPIEVDAVQVLQGRTTKADILAVCPQANVGVPALPGGADDPSSTDLRWVVIPTASGPVEAGHGDFIVRVPSEHRLLAFRPIAWELVHTPEKFRVMSSAEFHGWFEPIEGEQRG